METNSNQHYLFVHFIGDFENGEQIYFSVSEDGLHFNDLNNGQPVLTSSIGEKGVRDPFIVKHPKDGTFYLIGTDLSMYHRQHDWKQAVINGSQHLLVWESSDLVHWSEPRLCKVGVHEAGCVWAPEAVYDEEKEAFLVFWASNVQEQEDQERKHRIYASHTQDFNTFTEPVKYIEREQSVIDTTIISTDELYYRFTKDEASKKILMERGDSLFGEFSKIDSELLAGMYGLEGPQAYPLPTGEWVLIVDQFAEGLGYTPLLIKDFNNGELVKLDEADYHFGETKKRHGGVLPISADDYQRLIDHYNV